MSGEDHRQGLCLRSSGTEPSCAHKRFKDMRRRTSPRQKALARVDESQRLPARTAGRSSTRLNYVCRQRSRGSR